MLRITVDLVPYGFEQESRAIAEVIAWNAGYSKSDTGYSYQAVMKVRGRDNETYQSEVHGFDRMKNVLELVPLLLKNKKKCDLTKLPDHLQAKFKQLPE